MQQQKKTPQQIFFDLYKKEYKRAINYIILHFIDHTGVAEDIVQNSFIDLWIKVEAGGYDFEYRKQIQKYFYKSIVNKCIDYRIYKEALQRREMIFSKWYHSGFDVVIHMDEKTRLKLIKKAIGKLPKQCKKIFELARIHEVAGTEIAKEMNLKPKTVYSQCNRAVKLIRETIKDEL